MPTAISRMLQGRSATRLQNSRSLSDRPYCLSRLPATLRAAIAASDDAAIAIEFSRAVTKRRLGVDPIEIPGAHSTFLARSGELAGLLRYSMG